MVLYIITIIIHTYILLDSIQHHMNRIRLFFDQWINAISKFPIAYIILTIMTIGMMYTVYSSWEYNWTADEIIKIITTCLLALPLSIIPALIDHIKQKNKSTKTLLYSCIAIIAWIAYYTTLPFELGNMVDLGEKIWVIWGILLARTTPFFCIAWVTKDNDIFTRTRRKSYKLSILFGLLGGGIVRAGISACVASLEYLFGIHIQSETYWYIGSIAMIFIAWSIWLMHILQEKIHTTIPEYTRSMRIFGHYIFLPLTLIYAIILISYGIKILITGIWPQGTVVYMVIWYVLFGLATWYSTYPALPDRRLSKAHNILFITFFLTSLLMIKAIRLRITQYGITVDRYFVCMIIIAIILMSIAALLRPKYRHLVTITILIALGAISVYGWPINATNTATRSQINILTKKLQQNNVTLPLQSWSLAQIASGDAGQIYSTIVYLSRNTTSTELKTLFTPEQQALIETQNTYTQADYISNYLWLQNANNDILYGINTPQEYFSLNSHWNNYTQWADTPLNIGGYNSLYIIDSNKATANPNTVRFAHNEENYTINLQDYIAAIYKQASVWPDDTRNYNTDTIKSNPITPSANTSPYIITTGNMQLVITDISWYKSPTSSWDNYTIDYYRWYALVK